MCVWEGGAQEETWASITENVFTVMTIVCIVLQFGQFRVSYHSKAQLEI